MMRSRIALFLCALLLPYGSATADSSSGVELVPQAGHIRNINLNFAVNPANTLIASGDIEVKLWDMRGKLIKSFPVQGKVWEIQFSPDGETLAVVLSGNNRTLAFFNLKGVLLKSFPDDMGSSIRRNFFAFSPDGNTVAASTTRGIKLLDTRTFKEIALLRCPWALQHSVIFTADGKRLISASSPGRIAVWDTTSLKMLNSFQINAQDIVGVSLHLSQRTLAITDRNTGTSLHALDGKQISTIPGRELGMYSPKGDFFVSGQAGYGWIYTVDKNGTGLKQKRYLPISGAAFSHDSKTLFFINSLKLVAYDLESDTETEQFWPVSENTTAVAVNPASSMLIAATRSVNISQARIWDLNSLYWQKSIYLFPDRLQTGETLTKRQEQADSNRQSFNILTFSPDGKTLAAKTDGSDRYLIDSTNWTLLRRLEKPVGIQSNTDFTGKMEFTPDGKYIIGVLSINSLGLWRVLDGELEKTFARHPAYYISDFAVSPNGKMVITAAWDRNVRVWDIFRDTVVCSVLLPADASNGPVFFTDNGTFMTYDPNKKMATKWTLKGEMLGSTEADLPKLGSLRYNPLPKLLAVNMGTHVKIWNTRNNESAMLLSNGDDWLIATPDGYFDASPHGGELVKMVKDLKAYGIDQFAVRNNRPDLILERMGLGTTEEISHYYMLYKKRLQKLGLTEADLNAELNAPEARITGTRTEGKFATVSYIISDAKYPLKRYNFYVNDVPLYGPDGHKAGGRSFTGTETIELTTGRNKIELTAVNQAGAESYRALTYARYSGTEKGSLYYLGFGISKYKDASMNLDYADKDTKDLAATISLMRPGYKEVRVKTFLNSAVTAANFKTAKSFLKEAKTGDTVVLFIAGHGGYDKGSDPQYYYLPYEADANDLAATGITFETIEDILNDIKPRRKLFLMDTCEAGELDDETFNSYFSMATGRGIKPRTYRKPAKGRGDGEEKRRGYLYRKNRFIYNNISRRSGAIVLSSSRADEISYESRLIKNGFFTRQLIKALTSKIADANNNNHIDSRELLNYVSTAVATDTNDLQHPTIDRDNLFQDIELPISTYQPAP